MAYGYGKGLEQLIEITNEAYLARGLAFVEKRHRESKTFRSKGRDIVTGKAVVDYTGELVENVCIAEGHGEVQEKIYYIPVAFDAKECRDEKKFPLSYIKPHQFNYLKKRHYSMPGSENFIIIDMVPHKKIYRLDFPELERRWKGWQTSTGVPYDNKNGSYASISWEWIEQNLEPIPSRNGIILDYLNLGG